MSFILVKTQHTANTYVDTSVYWQYNKGHLVFLPYPTLSPTLSSHVYKNVHEK